MFSLIKGDDIIMGTLDLLNHATNFYKELFGPAQGNMFPLSNNLWHEGEVLNDEDNEWLNRPFSESEIKSALFQMETNKTAGPDKIPIEFYQSYWDIIKDDILELFNEFYEGGLNVSRLNYGIITLLPKLKEA